MPPKNTTFATEEERAAAATREEKKKEEETKVANAYPLKFLQSLGGNEHFAPFLKPKDNRPFFAEPWKRRVCVVPEGYMDSLVPSSPVAVGDLHEHSFKILASSLGEETLDRAGSAAKSILASLGNLQTLEMDPDTALPMMAKEGDAKKKRAVISSTVTPNHYKEAEVFMRYFPAFVAGEKSALFANAKVDGTETTLFDALFTKFLYGINPIDALPPQGSAEAKELWELNVRDKLFIVSTPEVAGNRPSGTDGPVDSYAIYYTIHMPDVEHVLDNVQCQGQRLIQQADERIVKHWINLTTLLVGTDNIPEAARLYVEKRLGSVNFDQKVLSIEAERVCSSTWRSLIEAGTESTNAKGRVVNEITPEVARNVTRTWVNGLFVNPSIDVTKANGDVDTELVFYSDNSERAKFGLLFTKANYHDAKTYQASDYHANLKKMSLVLKAVAYAILGKDPPNAIVVFDTEAAAATGAPKGRGRKRAATQAQVQETSGVSTAAFEELTEMVRSIIQTTDAVLHDVQKECKRSKKLREYVYANIPSLHEDGDGDE